jgi:hypothetical protein
MHELDGSKYKGSLKRAQKHGFGEKHFADGSVYQGNWRLDQRHG